MKAEGSCHHLPSSLSHLEVGERDVMFCFKQPAVTESTCKLEGGFT